MEIPELRKKVAEIEAKNAKLRHIIEENARRDAENAEHKARIEELEKITLKRPGSNVGYDGGYYYGDGRYERKVSSMMSPIISPVSSTELLYILRSCECVAYIKF